MIIFSFAMITIFMTYPKIKTGNIEVYSDWSFHGLRAEQIFLNLKGSYAELNGKRTTLINSARGTIKVRTKKESIRLPLDTVLQNYTMLE